MPDMDEPGGLLDRLHANMVAGVVRELLHHVPEDEHPAESEPVRSYVDYSGRVHVGIADALYRPDVVGVWRFRKLPGGDEVVLYRDGARQHRAIVAKGTAPSAPPEDN